MPNYGKCQLCGGEKKIACTDCRGTGQRSKLVKGAVRRQWCLTCDKTGMRPCPECTGNDFKMITYRI